MYRFDSDVSVGASLVNGRSNDGDYLVPAIIGVAGGGASGKTKVCHMIVERLQSEKRPKVAIINMEDFTRELTAKELDDVAAGSYNFDHPTAIDFDLLERTLVDLIAGNSVEIPEWDFTNHTRKAAATTLCRPDIIILEGTLILYKKRIRDHFNLRVFVDVDSDLRFAKQVVRDTEERYKKKLDDVIADYMQHVKPSFEEFILPSKKFADMIIPRGEVNTVAIDLLAKHISELLTERSDDNAATSITRRTVDQKSSAVRTLSPAKGVIVIS